MTAQVVINNKREVRLLSDVGTRIHLAARLDARTLTQAVAAKRHVPIRSDRLFIGERAKIAVQPSRDLNDT